MSQSEPVDLYRRAATEAVRVAAGVRPDQLGLPTPCAEWTVQDLLDHLVGGTRYLGAAVAGTEPSAPSGTTADELRAGVEACLLGLADPDALSRTCMSPLGFEWTVLEATAGTFMDLLIHTWDLAAATDQPRDLDAELVDACAAMFLPDMPERGRAAGIVGPAVTVARRRERPGSAARRHGPHAVTDPEPVEGRAAGDLAPGSTGDAAPGVGRRAHVVGARRGCRASRSRRRASTSRCSATPGSSTSASMPTGVSTGSTRSGSPPSERSSTSSGAITSTPWRPPPRRPIGARRRSKRDTG